MEKEKKALEANLLGRSILFSGLTGFTILLIPFMLYFVLFFGVVSISSFLDGRGDTTALFIALASLIISLIMMYVSMKNGRQLWAQWQRKQGLDAEEERVSRLMDDSAEAERDFSQNDEKSLQKKQ
jgi:small-conductance mechanosensitive channel